VLQFVVVVRSLILFTLMMESICSPDTSVFTHATQCHIPEDGILKSNLTLSYTLRLYRSDCVRLRGHTITLQIYVSIVLRTLTAETTMPGLGGGEKDIVLYLCNSQTPTPIY
jgi:hypothetical protein